MKNCWIVLLLILINFHAEAQKAEPVPTYAKAQKDMSWYQQQIKAWKQVIQNQPKDAEAWMHYYNAKRILVNHDTNDHRSFTEKDAEMNALVDDMEKSLPNSYEVNFCRWQLGGNDLSKLPYLQKAMSIDSSRSEHISYMINIGEMERNRAQRDAFSLKSMNKGMISSGMLYYNFNTLAGLEQHAILLTAGDNDTYPAWALQAKGIRKDVHVLNVFLLQKKDYRKKVFEELGLPFEEAKEKVSNENIVELISHNKFHWPVYVALTTAGCEVYTQQIEERLYLCGLVYRYDTTSFDHLAVLKRNFEKLYALDYLDKVFYPEISTELVERINTNYIIPMFKLYEHYRDSGDLQHQLWMKEKIILLAKGLDDPDTILKKLD